MKMNPHKNQIKAANAILNELKQASTPTLIFTAQPQSGKTGAILHALEQFEKDCLNKAKRLHIFSVNPSDKQLRHQTLERFLDSDIANNLIGGDVYHMPDLLENRSPQLRTLLSKIKPKTDILVIVWDEAHIGIGKSNRTNTGFMVIPDFLKQVLNVLPGMKSLDHIKSVIISATPFSYNNFNNKLLSFGISPIRETYMEPGKGYQGFSDMIAAGRVFSPAVYRNKNQYQDFKLDHKAILEKHKESNKYLVFRFTVNRHISWLRQLADEMDIPAKLFHSREKNIQEFETTLGICPSETKILIIQQSYKQGKTLDLSHIGLWYEGQTYGGRTDADLIQSAGRCCGYNSFTFPIYVRPEAINDAEHHYYLCSIGAFGAKNEMPMSDTATKFKKKLVTNNTSHYFNSEQEGKKHIISKGHIPTNISVATCSKNSSTDVARDAIEGNIRQGGNGRQNLIYLDGSNKKFLDSWKEVVNQGHVGKYVWVERGTSTSQIKPRIDKAYLDVYTHILDKKKNNTLTMVK